MTVTQRGILLRSPLSRCRALGIRAQAAAGVVRQTYSAPAQQVHDLKRQMHCLRLEDS